MHRTQHEALPGAFIRAKLNNDRAKAVEIGANVAELRERFVRWLNNYLMESITFPLELGRECGFEPDNDTSPTTATYEVMIPQGPGITGVHIRSRTAPMSAGQFPELSFLQKT